MRSTITYTVDIDRFRQPDCFLDCPRIDYSSIDSITRL